MKKSINFITCRPFPQPMTGSEYDLDFFRDEEFIRQKCPKCGRFFWARTEMELCGESPCIEYSFIGNPPTREKHTLHETREKYLSFFERNGHTRINRYPITARWRDDVFFTQASIYGFQPWVISGVVEPPANPLTISQTCVRFNDIDNVGRTGSHLTMFEMMAHDEKKHAEMMRSMAGTMEQDGYWFAVHDRTDNERFAGSEPYSSTSVAVAAARGYITDRIAATGYLQDHDLVIEVYLAAPVGGLVSGDAFHKEQFVHLETTPLREVLPAAQADFSEARIIEIADELKSRLYGDTFAVAEVNMWLSVVLGIHDGDVDGARQNIIDRGKEFGVV